MHIEYCICTDRCVVYIGCQRTSSWKTSEVRTMVMVSISTIMSTTSSCQGPIMSFTMSGTGEFTGKNTVGHKTFLISVAFGVAEVGSLFPRLRASICKSCWQKVHRTVARARFALENVKNYLLKTRSAKCTPDCSRSLISQKIVNKTKGQRGAAKPTKVRTVGAERMNFAVTKCNGTAVRSQAWVMLRGSWQAGLQLEVPKCIVTAARKVCFDHIVLLWCAMRDCSWRLLNAV